MDSDSQNRIAIAGFTFDSGIANLDASNGVPFVALISEGNNYLFAKVFNKPGEKIVKVRFTEEGDGVAVLTDAAKFWVAKIDLTGQITKSI